MQTCDSPATTVQTRSGTGVARRQVNGALILTVTMLGVSASNYGLHLLLARFLTPAQFGDANLAVNVVLVAAAAAATLQLLSARLGAIGDPAAIAARRRLMRCAWMLGGAVGLAMILGANTLAAAFSTSTPLLFVALGAGIPVYLAQAVMRGALQGDLRLGQLALSYAVEATARVAFTLVMLTLGFGVTAAAVAISLSFVASAITVGHRTAQMVPTAGLTGQPRTSAVSASAIVLLTAQVVIANGDVILAKAVMTPQAAGAYAAAAIIGRGLYFLSWAVVHSTFPVVARTEDPEERRSASLRALSMVAAFCVVGVTALALLGGQLAPLLLGADYAGAADVVVPYAVATSFFAIANLVASLDLAVGRRHAPLALLLGALLQTLLLLAFGSTPMSMVFAQVAAMLATVVLVGAAHLRDNRSDLPNSHPAHPTDKYGV